MLRQTDNHRQYRHRPLRPCAGHSHTTRRRYPQPPAAGRGAGMAVHPLRQRPPPRPTTAGGSHRKAGHVALQSRAPVAVAAAALVSSICHLRAICNHIVKKDTLCPESISFAIKYVDARPQYKYDQQQKRTGLSHNANALRGVCLFVRSLWSGA